MSRPPIHQPSITHIFKDGDTHIEPPVLTARWRLFTDAKSQCSRKYTASNEYLLVRTLVTILELCEWRSVNYCSIVALSPQCPSVSDSQFLNGLLTRSGVLRAGPETRQCESCFCSCQVCHSGTFKCKCFSTIISSSNGSPVVWLVTENSRVLGRREQLYLNKWYTVTQISRNMLPSSTWCYLFFWLT